MGASDSSEILEKSKNILAKESNHYVFKMNWTGQQLSVAAFKNWIISEEEAETTAAAERNELFDFQTKWEYIKLLLNSDNV